MNELKGKIGLITGAAMGLGKHLAKRLAAEGCDLVICDIKKEEIESAKEELVREIGARVIALNADVTSEEDVKNMVAAAVKEFSRIDLLVCNAGLSFSGAIHEIELAAWRKIIDVNLYGYFLCVREVSRIMKENKYGVIVQINSRTGKRGSAKNSAYAASKGGGIVLTQSLSAELAEFNIRVNCVCLGPLFESNLWQNVLFKDYAKRYGISEGEVKERYLKEIPLGRGCEYDDVANVVIFLLSDQANYMTGQAVNVTGGATVW
jgi:sorbitol-6-phosphate 2-dehydrogenase